MGLRIHSDLSRFNDVIKGRIKKNLKEYIKSGEFIAKQGNDKVSVPVSRIDLPHFRFLDQSKGGVGQGQGKSGESCDQKKEKAAGNQKAGSDPSDHTLEVEVNLGDLADMLGEELGLLRIEKRGSKLINTETVQYTGIHNVGPNALRHFKRSFKNALKRQIIMGTYDPKNPV